MKKLILMVGLPRSGKTTTARSLGHPIVCPDAIRLALHGRRFEPLAEPMVWAVAKIMARSLFLAGHDWVIVDACHTTRKRRVEWRDDMWRVTFAWCDADAEECKARAEAIGDDDIMPIIDRMAAEFEPPVDGE